MVPTALAREEKAVGFVATPISPDEKAVVFIATPFSSKTNAVLTTCLGKAVRKAAVRRHASSALCAKEGAADQVPTRFQITFYPLVHLSSTAASPCVESSWRGAAWRRISASMAGGYGSHSEPDDCELEPEERSTLAGALYLRPLPFHQKRIIAAERTISSSHAVVVSREMSGARGIITAFARILVSEPCRPLGGSPPCRPWLPVIRPRIFRQFTRFAATARAVEGLGTSRLPNRHRIAVVVRLSCSEPGATHLTSLILITPFSAGEETC